MSGNNSPETHVFFHVHSVTFMDFELQMQIVSFPQIVEAVYPISDTPMIVKERLKGHQKMATIIDPVSCYRFNLPSS